MSGFGSLLAVDTKPNLLFIKKGFHMAGEDVNLPGGLEHFSACLRDVQNHGRRSLSEMSEILLVAGAQLCAKAALDNHLQACQHLFHWLSSSWHAKKQEVQVLQKEIGVVPIKPSTLVTSDRNTLGPHPIPQLVGIHQHVQLLQAPVDSTHQQMQFWWGNSRQN